MRPPLPSALATDLACSMAVGRSGCLCASAKCQVPSAPRSRGPPRAPGPRPRARPPPTRSSKSATVSSRALCRPHSPASGGLFAARSAISTTASSRASRVSAASPEGLGALCKRPSRGPAFQPQGSAVTRQRRLRCSCTERRRRRRMQAVLLPARARRPPLPGPTMLGVQR